MNTDIKRMVVTGREGQVVQSLMERGKRHSRFELEAIGRPDLNLTDISGIEAVLRAAKPDVIVSAAAYTAVDQAESDEEVATAVNGVAAGEIARVAARLEVPVIHLSTDYVFDGSKVQPYTEDDQVNPIGAYGRSKLAGELAVVEATNNYAILRTAWVYSPFGKNFLKAMLRLAETRDHIDVVCDQVGNPTSALDIADGVLSVAANMVDSDSVELRGIFNMTGAGEASWADFAEEIFAVAAANDMPSATIGRIVSTQYPTPAKRPANSRLDCWRIGVRHGIFLPDWKMSTAAVVERLALSREGGDK